MNAGEARPMEERKELSIGPGDVIAEKYCVERQIGAGGMGIVLAARHLALGSLVAIKILRLDDDEELRAESVARFLREARAAARIQNDHIVQVTDVAELADGTPYMVMEHLDGEDLRQLIDRRGQLPVEEAVDLVLQACDGLAEAHAAGVIHRDLKPSNLFLARRKKGPPTVKVLDFGISKVATRPGEVAITTTTSLMGSPLYMAPEQMRSSKQVDLRADIWSIGLILYELLAGRAAFLGETVPAVCAKVMCDAPTPIRRYRADLPPELVAIVMRCLEKLPASRHDHMSDLARDLAKFGPARGTVPAELDEARASSTRGSTGSGTRRSPSPAAPDSLPSWAAGGEGNARREAVRKVAAAVLAATVLCGLALVVVPSERRTLGRAPESPPLVSASVMETANAPPPPSPGPPSLAAAPESVPVESLPLAPASASSPPRPPRPVVRAPHPAEPSASPAPSAAPTAKDSWKWGDRN